MPTERAYVELYVDMEVGENTSRTALSVLSEPASSCPARADKMSRSLLHNPLGSMTQWRGFYIA